MKLKYNFTRLCTFGYCTKKYYQHGFCRNHYQLFRRNGKPLYKKDIFNPCSMLKCDNKVSNLSRLGLCNFHWMRMSRSIELDRPRGIKGENNPRWNGGTSEYPNHFLMKKVRKEILEEANYTCQYCGNFTKQIHHKDLSKDNHSKENLAACCQSCNIKMGKSRKAYDSKYIRLYNFSAKEMSDKLQLKIYRIYKLHKQNKLKELI